MSFSNMWDLPGLSSTEASKKKKVINLIIVVALQNTTRIEEVGVV